MRFLDLLMVAARGPGSFSYDTDAAAYFAAVVAAGGTVSDARKSIINTFIVNEKAAGIWPLHDDCGGLWAENATQALVSLKQLRTATVTAAPTFTVDRDYTFDGATNFINTGFVPSTHCVVGSGTEQRLAVYERTNVTGSFYSMGAFTSGTVSFRLLARNGTNASMSLNSGLANSNLPAANSQGLTAVSRTGGGTTAKMYKNGAARPDMTGLTVGTTLTANAIYIGCYNNAGTAAAFRAASIGFWCIGAPLSAAQELAHYNNVQAWATAVGANV